MAKSSKDTAIGVQLSFGGRGSSKGAGPRTPVVARRSRPRQGWGFPAPPRGGPSQSWTANPAGGVSAVEHPVRGAQRSPQDCGPSLAVLWPFRLSCRVPASELGAEGVEQTRKTPLSTGSLWSSEAHTRQIKEQDRPQC